MPDTSDITEVLCRWSNGDKAALEELLPMLYGGLKQLAHVRLRGERADHTLGTTALVHEAYLRLVDVDRMQWQDRSHFFAAASTTMRRILVDYARRRTAQKRGGSDEDLPLEERLIPDEQTGAVLELDDALERMGEAHARQSKAIELYYLAGLTLEETAAVLDVSAPTAMRDVRFAEAWLAREWKGDREALPEV